MSYIKMDDKDLKRFERDLKTFKARAYPFATKDTVNTAAFQTRGEAQSIIRERMINRNQWTARSVRVEQARTLEVRKQAAAVGSIEDYMERQEFGGTVRATGKHGVPIPSSVASGEGRGARPRMRLPTRPNKMQNIQLRKRNRGVSARKRRNAIAINQAIGSGRRHVFLDLQRTPGIYRVSGSQSKPRLDLIWAMSRRTVRTPPTPWLNPATVTVTRRLPGIYKKQLKRQLVRHRIFTRR